MRVELHDSASTTGIFNIDVRNFSLFGCRRPETHWECIPKVKEKTESRDDFCRRTNGATNESSNHWDFTKSSPSRFFAPYRGCFHNEDVRANLSNHWGSSKFSWAYPTWLWLTVRHGIFRWPIEIDGLPIAIKWWFSLWQTVKQPDGKSPWKNLISSSGTSSPKAHHPTAVRGSEVTRIRINGELQSWRMMVCPFDPFAFLIFSHISQSLLNPREFCKFQRFLETANKRRQGENRDLPKFQFLSCSSPGIPNKAPPTRHPQQGTPNGSVITPRRELATVSNEERVTFRCQNLGELGILMERNGGVVRWENQR